MCRWKSFRQKGEKFTRRLGNIPISNSGNCNGVLEGKECARRSGCRSRQMTKQKPLIPQMPGGNRKSSKVLIRRMRWLPVNWANWRENAQSCMPCLQTIQKRKTLLLAINSYLQKMYKLLENFQFNTSSSEPNVPLREKQKERKKPLHFWECVFSLFYWWWKRLL